MPRIPYAVRPLGMILARRTLASVASHPKTSTETTKKNSEVKSAAKNQKLDAEKLEKGMARFWELVSCQETPEGFMIQMNGKTLKTPLGNQLVIPKEKPSLAYLLANEWKSLPSLRVQSYLLTLTSMTARAIDLSKVGNDQDAKAKVGDIENIKKWLMRYLDTDTLLVFSPAKDCDGKLRVEQQKLYYPIKKDMEKFLTKFSEDHKPVALQELDTEKVGLRGNKQSEQTIKAALKYLDTLNTWQLVALERATLTCKSLLCGIALVRMNDPNDDCEYELEDIAKAATLETILQTQRWGEVEDTHDVQKVDVRRLLAASSLLCYERGN